MQPVLTREQNGSFNDLLDKETKTAQAFGWLSEWYEASTWTNKCS